MQSREQHSPSVVHVLPEERQAVVRGTHLPAVQVPLQQVSLVVHACWSEMHAEAPHFPPTQFRLQHSVEVPQLAPFGAQVAVVAAQVCELASHSAEQQSAPVLQTSPYRWHADGPTTGPVLPSGVDVPPPVPGAASTDPLAPAPDEPPPPSAPEAPEPPAPVVAPLLASAPPSRFLKPPDIELLHPEPSRAARQTTNQPNRRIEQPPGENLNENELVSRASRDLRRM